MNRRSFFRRAAGAAGVAVIAPVVALMPAPSEEEQIQALVDDVLANPGKHPEIEARARMFMGRSLLDTNERMIALMVEAERGYVTFDECMERMGRDG
jgi:hypothetical protein